MALGLPGLGCHQASIWSHLQLGREFLLQSQLPNPQQVGKGKKILEDPMPPFQPQVGGILRWYWQALEMFRLELWRVEVLYPRHCVFFHRRLPVM